MTATATKTKKTTTTTTKKRLTAEEWAAKVVTAAKKAIMKRGTAVRVFEVPDKLTPQQQATDETPTLKTNHVKAERAKAEAEDKPLRSVWDGVKPMTAEEEEVFCSTSATHNHAYHSDDPIENGCFKFGITSDGKKLIKGLVPLVVTLPAGDYYITDPFYVLGGSRECFVNGKYERTKDDWMDILDVTESFDNPYSKNGMTAVAFRTSMGDGGFFDQFDRTYGVDTGMIACVPVAMVHRTEHLERKDLLHKVTFTAPFDCMAHEGILIFGDIVIDTRCD